VLVDNYVTILNTVIVIVYNARRREQVSAVNENIVQDVAGEELWDRRKQKCKYFVSSDSSDIF